MVCCNTLTYDAAIFDLDVKMKYTNFMLCHFSLRKWWTELYETWSESYIYFTKREIKLKINHIQARGEERETGWLPQVYTVYIIKICTHTGWAKFSLMTQLQQPPLDSSKTNPEQRGSSQITYGYSTHLLIYTYWHTVLTYYNNTTPVLIRIFKCGYLFKHTLQISDNTFSILKHWLYFYRSVMKKSQRQVDLNLLRPYKMR